MNSPVSTPASLRLNPNGLQALIEILSRLRDEHPGQMGTLLIYEDGQFMVFVDLDEIQLP